MSPGAAALVAAALLTGCAKPPEPEKREAQRNMPEIVHEEPAAGEPQDPVDSLDETGFRPDIEREVFAETIREREREGKSALTGNADAAKAARYQSRCLARHGLLGHDTIPCGSLRGRLDAFKIPFLGAENLDFIDVPSGPLDRVTLDGKPILRPGGPPPERVLAEAVVRHWLKSPKHRDNLLSPEQTDLGVGVYWSGGRLYATQVFLRKTECGVEGQLCCPTMTGGRYCFAPYSCGATTDVCRR
ncbi:MAG: hypothetical protein HY553_00520 [Elusimicrobia bacterium]|nr:hypothetical protein [Elusimicrobiota bacterium]